MDTDIWLLGKASICTASHPSMFLKGAKEYDLEALCWTFQGANGFGNWLFMIMVNSSRLHNVHPLDDESGDSLRMDWPIRCQYVNPTEYVEDVLGRQMQLANHSENHWKSEKSVVERVAPFALRTETYVISCIKSHSEYHMFVSMDYACY